MEVRGGGFCGEVRKFMSDDCRALACALGDMLPGARAVGLRRQAVARENGLFVGSNEGARANAVFTSLLASCGMLEIEPWS
jgi:hypothetical protein